MLQVELLIETLESLTKSFNSPLILSICQIQTGFTTGFISPGLYFLKDQHCQDKLQLVNHMSKLNSLQAIR